MYFRTCHRIHKAALSLKRRNGFRKLQERKEYRKEYKTFNINKEHKQIKNILCFLCQIKLQKSGCISKFFSTWNYKFSFAGNFDIWTFQPKRKTIYSDLEGKITSKALFRECYLFSGLQMKKSNAATAPIAVKTAITATAAFPPNDALGLEQLWILETTEIRLDHGRTIINIYFYIRSWEWLWRKILAFIMDY